MGRRVLSGLKVEKKNEHAYSFTSHNSEGYEKVIPLTK